MDYNGYLHVKGAAASNHFEGGAFVRSNNQVAYPNLMFHFLPIAVRYDGQKAPVAHGYQVHVGPMYSNSRGSLKLNQKIHLKNQVLYSIIYQQKKINKNGLKQFE